LTESQLTSVICPSRCWSSRFGRDGGDVRFLGHVRLGRRSGASSTSTDRDDLAERLGHRRATRQSVCFSAGIFVITSMR